MNMQTWTCDHCGITCTRVAVRGQRPRWCSLRCKQHGNQKKICIDCGSTGVRMDSVRCPECATHRPARLRREAQRKARIDRATQRLAKAAQGTSSQSMKTQVTCIICTTKFIVTWFGTHSTVRTCSELCAREHTRNLRRLAHDRRRALQKQAFVANVYRKRVFERDKWRCHICRKKVKQDAVVPHPLAPTIDHLVPLAAGGTHEPANVATACFKCNHTKGPRGHGEQLALIG